MIAADALIRAIIKGRTECYVKKSLQYNPYTPSDLYDWEFRLEQGDLIFTDAYRGFNPYSGVEYIYECGHANPCWRCDYVGYVAKEAAAFSGEIYGFLKGADGFLMDFTYADGMNRYESRFEGSFDALLQFETIYRDGTLAAQQLTAGQLKISE